MALTGILFWFFGFFIVYIIFFFFGKYGLNTNNQANISRKRQFSNVFRSWMNKENHALLFGHRGGGGIQRNANNAFRPDTRDPDRVVSYAQFVWKKRNTYRLSCKNIALDNCKEQTFSKVPCGMTFSNVYTLPFNSLLLILKSV